MTTPPPWPRRGLYLLTPDEPDTDRLRAMVAPLLDQGVAVLQLRNKLANPALLRDQALALLPLCQAQGVPLIINDDWQLARDVGAAGAHLGAGDGALAEARVACGPAAILGASCYDQLGRARHANASGANYVAFGACFPSGTKPHARRAPLSLFANARELGLSTVAIGGITPDNAPAVIAAGADFVAVLASVFDSPDPAATVRAFRSFFR